MKNYYKIIILSFLLTLLTLQIYCQTTSSQQIDFLNYDKNISDLIENLNEDSIQIIIEKSKYKLSIQYCRETIKCYPVVFGSNPIDDKLRQGDGCTPEGEFKILDKYPHHSWSKFLWIDYPTDDSWNKHKEAKSQNKILQNASIGGDIGIHGVPVGMDYLIDSKDNWTLGCVSLKNKDINEIYSITKVGTKVIIRH